MRRPGRNAARAELLSMIDHIADVVTALLNPALTRVQIVAELQALDDMLNNGDDEADYPPEIETPEDHRARIEREAGGPPPPPPPEPEEPTGSL